MSRYLLTFYKKGNMRFISHLDLQRLFRRALYKAEIPLLFSQGFNPHSITNIVMPLSLGFEAEKDYFEFETIASINQSQALEELNSAMPEGVGFISIKEIPKEKKNLSAICGYSEYKVLLPLSIEETVIAAFLNQDKIMVFKRDKKSKAMVELDMKDRIYSVDSPVALGSSTLVTMVLRSASNETLNPSGLCDSLISYCGKDCIKEYIRISRSELYAVKNNKLIPLSAYYE